MGAGRAWGRGGRPLGQAPLEEMAFGQLDVCLHVPVRWKDGVHGRAQLGRDQGGGGCTPWGSALTAYGGRS